MQRREFLRATGAGAGAIGLGAGAASGAEQEDEEESGGDGGGGSETVIVGPNGELVFEPESLSVQPGTTVTWEWDSDNHNVNPTSVPDESDWEGHEPIENTGFTYEHTFEVEGTYEYQCDPHASAGMVGEVVVDPNAGQDEGGHAPTVPASAMSLAIAIVAAMTSTVGLAFFFLKYGGRPEE